MLSFCFQKQGAVLSSLRLYSSEVLQPGLGVATKQTHRGKWEYVCGAPAPSLGSVLHRVPTRPVVEESARACTCACQCVVFLVTPCCPLGVKVTGRSLPVLGNPGPAWSPACALVSAFHTEEKTFLSSRNLLICPLGKHL